MRKQIFVAALMICFAAAASGQTTYTYEYDKYGRLVRVERSSGASSRVRYYYDGADNRTRVKQGTSNPVANADWALVEPTYGALYLSVLANDTDADFPNDTLTVTGVSGVNSGYASILYNDVYVSPFIPDGSYSWTYSMHDADGHTANGTVNVDVFRIICGEFEC